MTNIGAPVYSCLQCGGPLQWHGEALHCRSCKWVVVANPLAVPFGQLRLGEIFVFAVQAPGSPELVMIKSHQRLPYANAHPVGDRLPYLIGEDAPVIRARDRRISGLFSWS